MFNDANMFNTGNGGGRVVSSNIFQPQQQQSGGGIGDLIGRGLGLLTGLGVGGRGMAIASTAFNSLFGGSQTPQQTAHQGLVQRGGSSDSGAAEGPESGGDEDSEETAGVDQQEIETVPIDFWGLVNAGLVPGMAPGMMPPQVLQLLQQQQPQPTTTQQQTTQIQQRGPKN